jgi:hypothetical protein
LEVVAVTSRRIEWGGEWIATLVEGPGGKALVEPVVLDPDGTVLMGAEVLAAIEQSGVSVEHPVIGHCTAAQLAELEQRLAHVREILDIDNGEPSGLLVEEHTDADELGLTVPTFIDAQAMAREHPDTFFAPDPATLATIRPGDYVKVAGSVCSPTERFWVQVTQVTGDRLAGTVQNLLLEVPLEQGAPVAFERRHVYDVRQPEADQ